MIVSSASTFRRIGRRIVEWQTEALANAGDINILCRERCTNAAEPAQYLFTDLVDASHFGEIDDQSFWN